MSQDNEDLRLAELHMKHAFGLRRMGLVLSGMTILIGAVMTFMGLQGWFNWAIPTPTSIEEKLTNASPGIVFAAAGIWLALVAVTRLTKLEVQYKKKASEALTRLAPMGRKKP
jgi:hypothetical protein